MYGNNKGKIGRNSRSKTNKKTKRNVYTNAIQRNDHKIRQAKNDHNRGKNNSNKNTRKRKKRIHKNIMMEKSKLIILYDLLNDYENTLKDREEDLLQIQLSSIQYDILKIIINIE